MSLLEQVENSIGNEVADDNKYDKMLDMVKDEDSLSDADKALISAMFVKISTDEDTHKLMLKIIRDVLVDSHRDEK